MMSWFVSSSPKSGFGLTAGACLGFSVSLSFCLSPARMHPFCLTYKLKLKTKLKISLLYESVILLLGIYPQNTKTLVWKHTCPPMFIAALFAISQDMEAIQMLIHGWIDIVIKKAMILPFATQWMNLEGIRLSEIIQTEKDKYPIVSFIRGI